MPFTVRPLRAVDLVQCEEIEREAFPGHFPPTSFRRELTNSKASYLVASRRASVSGNGSHEGRSGNAGIRPGLPGGLMRRARDVWGALHPASGQGGELIAGFVGTWYLVDEAHIITVGVRRAYRGRGLGELLLIAAIEQAVGRGVRIASLEVRPSNNVARNLYGKYGFEVQGVRKGYYTDDREDALIMSTGPIQSASYRELFLGAKDQHQRHWGRAELLLDQAR